ncbi:hypothetical protein GEMRC1_006700 [Eukaryota sp. GEM-RC1]
MGSVKSLIPKPPSKNVSKILNNVKIKYRFRAKLVADSIIDCDRRFVITWFDSDDTLSIFEESLPNSGIVGGQFLGRSRPKKADGKIVTLEDLGIGKEVAIYSRVFRIVDADQFTRDRLNLTVE